MSLINSLLAVVVVTAFASCTNVHDIQTLGPNQYMATGRNCGGMFVNYPKFKAKVQAAANKFAAKQGMRAVQTDSWERNRWIPGLPYYEYKFRLEPAGQTGTTVFKQ